MKKLQEIDEIIDREMPGFAPQSQHFRFVAVKPATVRRGKEIIARAKSRNWAQRIADALNAFTRRVSE